MTSLQDTNPIGECRRTFTIEMDSLVVSSQQSMAHLAQDLSLGLVTRSSLSR